MVRQYRHKPTSNGPAASPEQAMSLAAALEGEFGVPFTLFDAANEAHLLRDSCEAASDLPTCLSGTVRGVCVGPRWPTASDAFTG